MNITISNHVSGGRKRFRLPASRARVLAELRREIPTPQFECYADGVSVYAVADEEDVVVTLYGDDPEAALAVWNGLILAIGRALK